MLLAAPQLYIHINISLNSACLIRHLYTDVNTTLEDNTREERLTTSRTDKNIKYIHIVVVTEHRIMLDM